MKILLIPNTGDPFFGDDIPDSKVGDPIIRLKAPFRPVVDFRPDAQAQTVETETFTYKGTVVRRGGQPCIAFYEQV